MAAGPSPRWAHFSAPIEGKLYVCGGRTADFENESTMHVFDRSRKSWEDRVVSGGVFPPAVYSGGCASAGHHLYLYGGLGKEECYHSFLYRFDAKEFAWSQLVESGPRAKAGCRMVIYDNTLVLFGGYGYPASPQPGVEYITNSKWYMPKRNEQGWTNELHTLDLDGGTNVWSATRVNGSRPPACAEFSLTMVDDHTAVMFGGHEPCSKPRRTNDVYFIDLPKMYWFKQDYNKEDPCPEGRKAHAAICLGYGDHPKLFITGGFDNNNGVLSDSWIFDLELKSWKEIEVPGFQSNKFYHSATAFSLSPKLTEVVVFGGCPSFPKTFLYVRHEDFTRTDDITVLQFESHDVPFSGDPPVQEWTLAENDQLGMVKKVPDLPPWESENKPNINVLTELGIMKKVSSEWRKLGVRLGQSTNDLDNYVTRSMLDNDICCERVFSHWINNGGHPPHYPLSWKGVYDVLCAIEHRGTADDMKTALASYVGN